MEYNDILDGQNYEDDHEIDTSALLESLKKESQLQHEQQLITKKQEHNAFSVARKVVNSKEYHDKFIMLPVNHKVQEKLYKEAGRSELTHDELPWKETRGNLPLNAKCDKVISNTLIEKAYAYY